MSENPGISSNMNESVDNCDSLRNCTVDELTVSGRPESISVATDFSFINSPIYLPPKTIDESNDLMRAFIEIDNLKSEVEDLSSKILMLNRELEQMEEQLNIPSF